MVAVERTHLLSRDLEWLPASVRRTRTLVAGVVWGVSGTVIGALLAVSPGAVAVMWKGIAAGAAGIAVAGERVGQQLLRRKLRKVGTGEIELATLEERADGELVVVEGTIEAEAPLSGMLTTTAGVYRRVIVAARRKYVHEAAVDFALVDDAGHRILVQAAGARWLVPRRELVAYPLARLTSPPLPEALAATLARRGPTVQAIEDVLQVGTRVQVVGYKTASTDVSGTVVDYRLPPQRATLRSGPQLPLVITRVSDLHR